MCLHMWHKSPKRQHPSWISTSGIDVWVIWERTTSGNWQKWSMEWESKSGQQWEYVKHVWKENSTGNHLTNRQQEPRNRSNLFTAICVDRSIHQHTAEQTTISSSPTTIQG